MSYSLPNGSTIHIGSAVGSALTVTAATNASPCVMTSTAHGLANGDYVIIYSSGWARTLERVFRVANITANTFELEGHDTSSTSNFAAGSGTGSVKKVTTWTQISQVLTLSSQGGEQQFATYQPLEGDREVRIPTVKTGGGLDIEVGDDPTLPGFVAAAAANDDRVPRAVRITSASGGKSLFYSYIGADKVPQMNVNQVMTSRISLSHQNEAVRYSS
jgi:hypothetical protein